MLPEKLFHYSKDLIKDLRQDFHDKHRHEIPIFQKPHGFWVSIEDFEDDQTWRTWCEAENFRLEALRYKYLVKIKPTANILYMLTPEQLEAFSLENKGPFCVKSKSFFKGEVDYISFIDWDKVMLEYDGIFIAPYQWSCRLMNLVTAWYYGWDCASGCVWNMDAIESFTMVEEIQVCQEVESGMD